MLLRKRRKQSGFMALADLGLALTFMLGLSSYGMSKTEPVNAHNEEQLIIDGFSEIIRASTQYRQGVTDGFASLTISDLTGTTGPGAGSLPVSWGTGVGTNPVNGNWTAGGTASELEATATGLSDALCNRVATKLNQHVTASCDTTTGTVTVNV